MDLLSELLSSSSSSSSSDEDILFLLGNANAENTRIENFMDVIGNYTETQFRKNLRVCRETADYLIEKFERSEFFKKKEGGGGKREIPAQKQIYVFLWFAGNKDSYREVANLFNISISTAHRILSSILEFIFKSSKEYIRFPQTEAEKLKVSREFEQIAGFKNVLGCIDGCYIYIRKPANKIRSTYINRHDLLSLTLQGICDANKKFIDVFVGCPSKIHDARIFQLSFISDELPAYCGQQYHILGDSAYPLREYLLTPYKDYGSLTSKKKKFNKKLSQTRVKIENAFSLLKIRFRQLMRLDFFTVERMSKFILACCVLHNLCIEQGDLWVEDENTLPVNSTFVSSDLENTIHANEQPRDAALRHLGDIKRNNIADTY